MDRRCYNDDGTDDVCCLQCVYVCVFNCILKGVDSSAQSHAIACTDKEHKSSRQSRPARAVEQLSTDSDR